MKIEIEEIVELDDGGARVIFSADSHVMHLLAAEGFLSILKAELGRSKSYHGIPDEEIEF